VLNPCYVSESNALLSFGERTLMLCSHREDARKFNELIIALLVTNERIWNVHVETNATDVQAL
jgi:hypothetical protein